MNSAEPAGASATSTASPHSCPLSGEHNLHPLQSTASSRLPWEVPGAHEEQHSPWEPVERALAPLHRYLGKGEEL